MKSTLSFALSIFYLLIAAVTAVPAASRLRGVPNNLFINFEFVAQYAAAAYCPNNSNSPNTKVTCAKGNCPLVEAANTVTVAEFEKSMFTDASGFVAIDHTNRIIVLSFRGTQSLKNFLTNLQFTQRETNFCEGCSVHQGFWNAWNEVRTQVLGAVLRAAQEFPNYHIVTTGHSLGGALAELAAVELRRSGQSVALYTFGAPKVGNAEFARFVTKQRGGNFRITKADDGIPKLPMPNFPLPNLPFQYSHSSPEFWIASNGPVVRPADINVLLGLDNAQGNLGTQGFTIDRHYDYFGDITGCGTGFTL